jgi:hypothetical protein
MFDGFVEERKRVSPTCLITFDRNRYSVPASFANRPVSLHVYPERLVIFMLKACLRHDAEGMSSARMSASLNRPTASRGASFMTAFGTTPMLSQLLKAEMAEREVRSIAYHMKAAFDGDTVPRTVS